MITVQDMMQTMRQTLAGGRPRPFSLVYCTADRQRRTGGQFREVQKAVILTKKRNSNRAIDIQPVGTRTKMRVHIDLILYFNNQAVL